MNGNFFYTPIKIRSFPTEVEKTTSLIAYCTVSSDLGVLSISIHFPGLFIQISLKTSIAVSRPRVSFFCFFLHPNQNYSGTSHNEPKKDSFLFSFFQFRPLLFSSSLSVLSLWFLMGSCFSIPFDAVQWGESMCATLFFSFFFFGISDFFLFQKWNLRFLRGRMRSRELRKR